MGLGFAMLLLLLPLFTTVGLLRGGGQGHQQAVQIVSWGLEAIAGVKVLALLSRDFSLGVHLWGVWMYVALDDKEWRKVLR